MEWIGFLVLVLVGFTGEVIFLKSDKKIKAVNPKEVPIPFWLYVKRSIGLGLFIGGFGVLAFGVFITFF